MNMRRPYSNISGYPNGAYPYGAYPYAGQPYNAIPYVAHSGSPQYYDPSQYNRKRQRRQAAAVVVQSLWSNNMGRKSTAQPRPVLNVPPRGIGPIVEPNENDVLCGRGGRINSHTGNVQFRDVIVANKKDYLAPSTKKLEKAHIAAGIVNDIRGMDPSGRFLKEDRDTGLWFDIGDAKAIKKTGQALREDAPDIRHEIEGDSSGDDKSPGDSPKKEELPAKDKKPAPKPKSPKATNNKPIASIKTPYRQQQGMVSGRGPQHIPNRPGGWPQGIATMTPEEYQAQVAMPPPFSQQVNPYAQQQVQAQMMMQMQGQDQGNFQTRNIPIEAPMPQGVYSLPNQLYSGARSVGQKVATASRQAMEVLSQSGNPGPNERNSNALPPDDIAFGMAFHPPSGTVLSSDNTMSTISGLSDPLSSNPGIDTGSGLMGFRPSAGMDRAHSPRGSHGMGNTRNPSLRLSQLGPGMGTSNRSHFSDLRASKISDLTASVRSMGSLSRSFSFPDMSSVADHDSWKAIMEGDEEMLEAQEQSIMSGFSGRLSTGSGSRMGLSARHSTAMSITSLSTASSGRWLAGLRDSNMTDDGRSILSEMSSDLNALDLAVPPM